MDKFSPQKAAINTESRQHSLQLSNEIDMEMEYLLCSTIG